MTTAPSGAQVGFGGRADGDLHCHQYIGCGGCTISSLRRTVSGWVNQADVRTMMGRSKGQLLAENKRLWKEVTALRKKVAELRNKEMALKQKLLRVTEQRETARALAQQAQDRIADLKAQLKAKRAED